MKDNKNRNLSILALIVCVLGLSMGFAAYTGTIIINKDPLGEPNRETFKVRFSSDSKKVIEGSIIPTTTEGAVGSNAVIYNSQYSVIKGINASFTKKGQTVTYKFYARNIGKHKAYLNDIIFQYIKNNKTKYCYVSKVGLVEPDIETINEVCSNISISVKVGNDYKTYKSVFDIDKHILNPGENETIIVTISYNGDVKSSSEFKVEFGDIHLIYGYID